MADDRDDDVLSAEDARLLDRLAAALGPDPQPEGMVYRLEGLLAFRDVDRELLELLQEAAAEPVGMRGDTETADRLVFQLGDGSVSLELHLDRDRLSGQLLDGEVTEVALERLAGPPVVSGVDPLGRFTFERPDPGPARLRLQAAAGQALATDWFLL